MIRIFGKSFRKGIVTEQLVRKEGGLSGLDEAGLELKKTINERFGRSFHIREVDTGSCGACESEIIAASNPVYDIQRFGIDFVASPRHADALLVTGPVSKNMETALLRAFEAMPGPRFVITFGDCALGGGIFKDSYYTCGGVSSVLPVHAHVPGCPPSPAALVSALQRILSINVAK